ncbi:hypothetical protein K432DRAFT_456446 [Lepidopterella palustris CBS 459.81]|uniref:Uncharacterized protein n=1 Tax=Lepidopterella palustris CBS 459.81 TaxID=1314670 RepID=A0A8E2JE40_9PEZI|nr:hypothetical protein K432DRAFT_456446 [Lepidopterella palustris CBS 459.81]
MIRTLLQSKENRDKLKSVGDQRLWIELSEIAKTLLKICDDATYTTYKGGTVLEAAGSCQTRVIEIFNDPRPSTAGYGKGANTILEDAVFTRMAKDRRDSDAPFLGRGSFF